MAGKPKIVVLDGFALNPGDLSWAALAALGDLSVHDRTPLSEVTLRAAGASVILTNKTPIDAQAIADLGSLQYIGVLATGTNIVDRAAAQARGIRVTNVPSYGADSVAEHAVSAMLDAVKHLSSHLTAVRAGAWARQPDFSFSVAPIRLLAGKKLGVVGFGAIGRRVAELAQAFRMQVLVAQHRSLDAREPHVRVVELDELFREADILSLHCPLTPATERLVDARRLGLMKRSAVLINTARGGLVDEAALHAALCEARIAGAYLDVLVTEPPAPGHPLIGLANCRVTPHIAWASAEARARLLDIATDNVRAFLAGTPRNVVPGV